MARDTVHYGIKKVVQLYKPGYPNVWAAPACGRFRFAHQRPFLMSTDPDKVTCLLCCKSLKFRLRVFDSPNDSDKTDISEET